MTRRRAVWSCLAILAVVTGVTVCLFACKDKSANQSNGYSGSSVTATSTVQPVTPQVNPPALSGVVEPPASGAYIGVYQPPAPFDISALDSYAVLSSKQPAILMWYQPWAADGPNRFDPAACLSVYQHGAVPMITWEPWDPGTDANAVVNPENQSQYRLANIVGGTFDEYIRQFARDVKSVRGPVMIRLMHEMNGDWYPWSGTVNGNSPQLYVAAWRHIHDLFVSEGATNVTWVWSVNHESVPDTTLNSYAAYYPGDEYVDWVAMSGFNWGTSSPVSRWQTFDYWYTKPLAYLKTLNKPVVLAEFGSVENGGNKAAWITDAYSKIQTQHPEVKAVIYYNQLEKQPDSVQDWRIASSQASVEAYRTALESPYYLRGPGTTLSSWTAGIGSDGWSYLRLLKPVY